MLPPTGTESSNLAPSVSPVESYCKHGQSNIFSYFIGLPVSGSKISSIELSKSLLKVNIETIEMVLFSCLLF